MRVSGYYDIVVIDFILKYKELHQQMLKIMRSITNQMKEKEA